MTFQYSLHFPYHTVALYLMCDDYQIQFNVTGPALGLDTLSDGNATQRLFNRRMHASQSQTSQLRYHFTLISC